MGKNFSRNQAGEDRNENDFYQTPYCLTRTFMEKFYKYHETRKGIHIMEPAAGHGAITKVLDEFGCDIIARDIITGYDFLKSTLKSAWIITNPPYKNSTTWIQKCKEIANTGFCLLLPTTYLQGKERYDKVWSDKDYPCVAVYTFTRYPMLETTVREDGKCHTGMQSLSWFVWVNKKNTIREYPNDTVHRWIDINDFIVRKGE
jgi:hypothetical protein